MKQDQIKELLHLAAMDRIKELLHLVAMGRRDKIDELAELLCPAETAPVEEHVETITLIKEAKAKKSK